MEPVSMPPPRSRSTSREPVVTWGGWQWQLAVAIGSGSGRVAVGRKWEKNGQNRSSIEGVVVEIVWQWHMAVAGWQWGENEKKMKGIGAVLRELWLKQWQWHMAVAVAVAQWQGGSRGKNEGNRSIGERDMVETVAHGSGSGCGTSGSMAVAQWQWLNGSDRVATVTEWLQCHSGRVATMAAWQWLNNGSMTVATVSQWQWLQWQHGSGYNGSGYNDSGTVAVAHSGSGSAAWQWLNNGSMAVATVAVSQWLQWQHGSGQQWQCHPGSGCGTHVDDVLPLLVKLGRSRKTHRHKGTGFAQNLRK
jgi:hypothetical protein